MGQSSAVERNTSAVADVRDLAVGAARDATTHRLVDSLLHDVRNPLNALSINLDVLTEKIRRNQGEVPASQEKNLRVMREQIHRVDGILRQYMEFIAPRNEGVFGGVDASAAAKAALEVLGHESRRGMVRLRQLIQPDLRVAAVDQAGIRFLVMQIVFRAILRAGQDGEVDVTLQAEGGAAVLKVKDSRPEPAEPFEHAVAAVERLAVLVGAEVRWSGSECLVTIPLKQEG